MYKEISKYNMSIRNEKDSMNGCQWQKKSFSIATGDSNNYDKIFKKNLWKRVKPVLEVILIRLVVTLTGSKLKQSEVIK